MPWPRRLVVRGPFRGPTGYDHHTREFVRAFEALGVEVRLLELPGWSPWLLPAARLDPRFAAPGPAPDPAWRPEAAIHFVMPPQFSPLTWAGPNLLHTMFEAPRAPAGWVASARRADRVVVPTASSREAFYTGGLESERLATIPLGVDTATFRPGHPPLALLARDGRPVADHATRFLQVAEYTSRKNIGGLLAAWLDSTTAADDTVLVLKLRFLSAGDRGRFLAERARIAATRGKEWRAAAPVVLYEGVLADHEMPRVYATATHYVSASHGEGWDQAMAEAAASGLRLIAPAHSGYLEYLDDTVARLVPAGIAAAATTSVDDPWIGPLFRDLPWWDPDLAALGRALRDGIEGRDATGPGLDPGAARRRMVQHYSWGAAARRLLELAAIAAAENDASHRETPA